MPNVDYSDIDNMMKLLNKEGFSIQIEKSDERDGYFKLKPKNKTLKQFQGFKNYS